MQICLYCSALPIKFNCINFVTVHVTHGAAMPIMIRCVLWAVAQETQSTIKMKNSEAHILLPMDVWLPFNSTLVPCTLETHIRVPTIQECSYRLIKVNYILEFLLHIQLSISMYLRKVAHVYMFTTLMKRLTLCTPVAWRIYSHAKAMCVTQQNGQHTIFSPARLIYCYYAPNISHT